MSKTQEKISRHKIARSILRTAIFIVVALFVMFYMELKFQNNDFESTFEYAFNSDRTGVFLYSVLIVFFIELTISSIFKAAWTGPAVTFIGAIILSYISSTKMTFRGQPLLPEDLKLADQAGTLTKFIDFGSLFKMILGCICIFLLAVTLNIISKKIFGSVKEKEGNKITKNFRVFRVLILVVGVVGFMTSTNFIINHTKAREEQIDWLNAHFVAWNQKYNYDINGPVIGFLYNLKKMDLEEPEGYSKEKIAEIKAENVDNSGAELKNSDYNIVMILNETFFDPDVISDYYPVTRNRELTVNSMGVPVTDDVIPTVHGLMSNDKKNKNVATGQMYSPDYGGGTANVEFEADTAMSNYFLGMVPYTDLLSHIESVPSIASIAKDAGYDTVAIHPFNGGMYKRNIALKVEGFDEFITEDEMTFKDQDENRGYINDRSAYNEVLKTLDEHESRTMVSLITMQNHMGYGADNYSTRSYNLSDVPKKGEFMDPFTDEEKTQYEIYLESLHNSDYYLSEFLEKLEKSDEKTVVLFYGDHAPGIFERLVGAETPEIYNLAHVTPYFVWANFELNDVPEASEPERFGKASGTTLPTTTPNCFVPTMFSLLSLKKPDFVNLADKVCREEPILMSLYFGSNAPEKTEILKNYELYIYDILGGKRYWYE